MPNHVYNQLQCSINFDEFMKDPFEDDWMQKLRQDHPKLDPANPDDRVAITKAVFDHFNICVSDADGHPEYIFDFNSVIPRPKEYDEDNDAWVGNNSYPWCLFVHLLHIYRALGKKDEAEYVVRTTGRGSNPYVFDKNLIDYLQALGYTDYSAGLADHEAKWRQDRPNVPDVRWDASKKILECYLLHGYTNWYDWDIANWGTKWNAYYGSSHLSGETFSMYFNTAWSAPYPIYEAMAEMYPWLSIDGSFVNEDWFSEIGTFEMCMGLISFYQPDDEDEKIDLLKQIYDYDDDEFEESYGYVKVADGHWINNELEQEDLPYIKLADAFYAAIVSYDFTPERTLRPGFHAYNVELNGSTATVTEFSEDENNEHIVTTKQIPDELLDQPLSLKQYKKPLTLADIAIEQAKLDMAE